MAPETGSFHLFCLSSPRVHLYVSLSLLRASWLPTFSICRAAHSVCVFCRRVEEVVRYQGLPPRRQLTYQAKQTISREMEQERMRRAEQLMLQRNPAAVRRRTCGVLCPHNRLWGYFNTAQAADGQAYVCVLII